MRICLLINVIINTIKYKFLGEINNILFLYKQLFQITRKKNNKIMDDQTEITTVEEVCKKMQSYGVSDYVIFVALLLSCCCVGLFHALTKKSIGEDEYLVGGRNMSVFLISMSSITSSQEFHFWEFLRKFMCTEPARCLLSWA